MRRTRGATPMTPDPSAAAARIPATCVPCWLPLKCGELVLFTKL